MENTKWVLPSEEKYKKELFEWVNKEDEDDQVAAFSMALTTLKNDMKEEFTDALDMLEWAMLNADRRVKEQIENFLIKFKQPK